MNIFTRLFSLALLLLLQFPMVAATVSVLPGYSAQASAGLASRLDRTWYSFSSYGASHVTPFASVVQGPATAPSLAARSLSPVLSVYPNPARGLITVSLGQKFNADYKFRLNNIIGREVRTISLRPEAADGGMALNLSDLPAGMYFYSLVLDNKVMSTHRLVLQN
jgi:hypothetical protein